MRTLATLTLMLATALSSVAATTWPAGTNTPNQTFYGNNNFLGQLRKNGVDVLTNASPVTNGYPWGTLYDAAGSSTASTNPIPVMIGSVVGGSNFVTKVQVGTQIGSSNLVTSAQVGVQIGSSNLLTSIPDPLSVTNINGTNLNVLNLYTPFSNMVLIAGADRKVTGTSTIPLVYLPSVVVTNSGTATLTNLVLAGQPSLPQFHSGSGSSSSGILIGIDASGNMVQSTVFSWAPDGIMGGLTNIPASAIAAGTAAINITGNADSATSLSGNGFILETNTTSKTSLTYTNGILTLWRNGVAQLNINAASGTTSILTMGGTSSQLFLGGGQVNYNYSTVSGWYFSGAGGLDLNGTINIIPSSGVLTLKDGSLADTITIKANNGLYSGTLTDTNGVASYRSNQVAAISVSDAGWTNTFGVQAKVAWPITVAPALTFTDGTSYSPTVGNFFWILGPNEGIAITGGTVGTGVAKPW